jgi:hypothetical protein
MDPSRPQRPVLSVHGEAGVSNNTTQMQPHRDHPSEITPPISIHSIESVCTHSANTAPEVSGHFAFARDHGEQDVGYQASNLDRLKALHIPLSACEEERGVYSRLFSCTYKAGETRVMHGVGRVTLVHAVTLPATCRASYHFSRHPGADLSHGHTASRHALAGKLVPSHIRVRDPSLAVLLNNECPPSILNKEKPPIQPKAMLTISQTQTKPWE